MRFSKNSVINVTATGFPALTSLTLFGMLATCPREVSDRFPCTARFVRIDGRWIFSLRDKGDPHVHIANLA